MKKYNYSVFYEIITARLRHGKYGPGVLNLINRILTLTMYILYPLMVTLMILSGYLDSYSITEAIRRTLPYVLIPGISFILLSIVRDRLNWKRPYEEYDIQPLIPKNTKGHSMPSRHVFSCTIIAMCILSLNLPAGIVCLLCSLALCLTRVLGGVHYPRDVAAGFAIGILTGCVLFAFV